jgi:ribose 5-phosphate isomerase
MPFYMGVECKKICGGKNSVWHARKPGIVNVLGDMIVGTGSTAELAIADLQKQARNRFARV